MPSIRDIMSTPVVNISPIKTVYDAAKLMTDRNVECLVVVWEDRVEGIITEKDIVRRVVARKINYDVKVLNVMSKPVITINSDVSIKKAREVMILKKISRLPVVEKGRLVGIVVASDLIRGRKQNEIKLINDFEDLLEEV